jgi:acyl-coenzyme A synthetase/AMP-(fatty) acid ligase
MWLWRLITASSALGGTLLHDRDARVDLGTLAQASSLDGHLEELRGCTVVLQVENQLTAALALVELDGVARRVVLCPPDVAEKYLAGVALDAEADAWVGTSDRGLPVEIRHYVGLSDRASLTPWKIQRRQSHQTEWVLLTSGTTGVPKLVLHTLETLTNTFLGRDENIPAAAVWSSFYDIRRYGGLQIFLRGIVAGSMVLSSAGESVTEFLKRAGAAGVTHISGTPSHWRKALMSEAAAYVSPRYIRLSGEIADQGILDKLRATFPTAVIAHAFASTEAGVGFEVQDGLAGFPAALAGTAGPVRIDVTGGTLRLQSGATGVRYLGANAAVLKTADGFVDTGDKLELRSGRYHFMGRSGGVINVGGLKVYPEEIEAVINAHSWVRMSRAAARKSPITGAVVVAEVVLADAGVSPQVRPADDQLRREILEACRSSLAPHKVPATVRFVPVLPVAPSGKLVRADA